MSKTFESELRHELVQLLKKHIKITDKSAEIAVERTEQAILAAAEAMGKRVIGEHEKQNVDSQTYGRIVPAVQRNKLRMEQLTRLSQELGSKEME